MAYNLQCNGIYMFQDYQIFLMCLIEPEFLSFQQFFSAAIINRQFQNVLIFCEMKMSM
jgi:hypothetical protein